MLTLKKAAELANEEYAAEVKNFTQQQEAAARAIVESEGRDLEDVAARVFACFLHGGLLDSRVLVIMCLRFGMRIQRKLDDPDQPTTVWSGATTESELGAGRPC